ncbi:MAG: hypothetical protein UW63_C0065G0003 [Candidatus Uhrbacteria bacterium GW2011_GWF2_44_350]|uniref:N-acetyltransferase domain-containing protein n=1 Tax=Candidatus Uhrbacteria bacterium GW2011_GWF2_44_350 TaxID=1619000 RepID=A0A0G1LJE2_9BACT|nr:MAG: hypothetical protein UW63_C0065G0003 [Candidatus Uhrbacteria bacterium GW2011_GWF2_44_350]HBR80596.1 hypothetical protein [Candidatus Uhrbacteria bacterium]HCU31867.1 hypothetical protein [Candidatus Uhrbacteria bacterium]
MEGRVIRIPDQSRKDLELTEQKKQDELLKSKIRQDFEEHYLPDVGRGGEEDDDWGFGSFGADEEILRHLGVPMREDRKYYPEQQKRVALFMREFVNFIRDKHRDPNSREDLGEYLATWREIAFSVSPNIFNYLALDSQMEIAALLSGIPEVQGTICQSTVGELVYELQWFGSQRKELIEKTFTRLNTVEKLDFLNYLNTIGSSALAQGWADDLYYDVLKFVSDLEADKKQHLFINYAARSAKATLGKEMVEPTRGVTFRSGDRSVGRQADQGLPIGEESRLIISKMKPDEISYTESVFRRISKDSVASFDRAGTAQSLAFIGREFLEENPDTAPVQEIEKLLEACERPNWTPDFLPKVLELLNDGVLGEVEKGDGKFWHREISSCLSAAEWKKYFSCLKTLDGAQKDFDQLVSRKKQEAGDANLVASQELTTFVKENLSRLEAEAGGHRGVVYHLEKIKRARNDDELFKEVESLVRAAELSGAASFPPVLFSVIEKHRQVLVYHHEQWEKSREQLDSEAANINKRLSRVARDFNILNSMLFDDRSSLQSDLTGFLEKRLAQADLPTVHFEIFENFGGHEKIQPKGSKQDIDSAQLLQEIHRPAMRRELENNFGFSLVELTLREQVQFSLFLAAADRKTVEKTFALSQKFGPSAARSFLSCEYGDQFREVILSIGEKLPEELARQVFEQYGKLALLAQEKSEELIKEFAAEGKELKVSTADVEQELLRRAKDFLAEVAKAGELSPESVQAKLAQYETDMVIFAGIFKTAFKGEKTIDLQKVRGLNLESRGSAEISSEDQKDILKIFAANWREQKPDSAEFLIQELKDKLAGGDSDGKFYLLKKDGELVAFVRFDKTDDLDGRPAAYGKSFNIKKGLRDSALGEAIMINAIGTEAANKTIVIDVFPELRAGTSYVENFGFVIVGTKEFPSGVSGKTETRLIMKRDDRVGSLYRKNSARAETKIFDLSKGHKEMLQVIKEMTDKNFVGTGFRSDPENKNLRYIVFEPEVQPEVLSKPFERPQDSRKAA